MLNWEIYKEDHFLIWSIILRFAWRGWRKLRKRSGQSVPGLTFEPGTSWIRRSSNRPRANFGPDVFRSWKVSYVIYTVAQVSCYWIRKRGFEMSPAFAFWSWQACGSLWLFECNHRFARYSSYSDQAKQNFLSPWTKISRSAGRNIMYFT
jgi:hypothetical protein